MGETSAYFLPTKHMDSKPEIYINKWVFSNVRNDGQPKRTGGRLCGVEWYLKNMHRVSTRWR